MRLFDVPALQEQEKTEAHRYQALGVSAQMLLIARLLELGHKVATPVTDDDGVDLIVNYKTLVQIKSSASRNPDGSLRLNTSTARAAERGKGSKSRMHIREHVDYLAVYARDSRTWWFIPRDDITSHMLKLSEYAPSQWREAWHVFDLHAAAA